MAESVCSHTQEGRDNDMWVRHAQGLLTHLWPTRPHRETELGFRGSSPATGCLPLLKKQ